MKLFAQNEIRKGFNEDAALSAVEIAFRAMHQGKAQIMAVGHLAFSEPPGDCHVKGAHLADDEVFVVKLACGFYKNPDRGISSSNGFMAVISASTGEVLGLLHDEGWLTDQRTAIAGAIAARAIARPQARTLGIVGAGIQAGLQAYWISRVLKLQTTLIWARDPQRANQLADKLGGAAASLEELCERSDIIVTTTPSTKPLLMSNMVHDGARIVAIGADSPGKQEIETGLTARCKIVVDSIPQCVAYGEAGWAVRAGLLDASNLFELGALLTTPIKFSDRDVVVADLTGVAVQDVAIAKSVWQQLKKTSDGADSMVD